jgi:hypothetical protein
MTKVLNLCLAVSRLFRLSFTLSLRILILTFKKNKSNLEQTSSQHQSKWREAGSNPISYFQENAALLVFINQSQ